MAPREKEPEPDDPFELRGVVLPAPDDSSLREMAACFAEEFLRDGWSDERLKGMFRDPFYTGPHRVWRSKGEAFVDEVIGEARRARGERRIS